MLFVCPNLATTVQHPTKSCLTTKITKVSDIYGFKLRALPVLRGEICISFRSRLQLAGLLGVSRDATACGLLGKFLIRSRSVCLSMAYGVNGELFRYRWPGGPWMLPV